MKYVVRSRRKMVRWFDTESEEREEIIEGSESTFSDRRTTEDAFESIHIFCHSTYLALTDI
jgi:hypothetical protein